MFTRINRTHSLRFVSLLVAPLAMALFSSPARGQGILDDFNDNITDTTLWSIGPIGTGVQVQEINQRVEVLLAANASDDPSSNVFGGGYGSNAALSGDFDIQVDYELLTWPFSSGVRVGLGTVSGAVERISFGDATNDYPGEPRESYLTHFDDGVNGIAATADPSGTLRMVRQGATVTGFYWDAVNSQWVTIHSGPTSTADTGFGFSAWSHDYAFTDQEVRVAFDNVRINDLTAVPEPGTVALGGALCGAGLLTWRRLRRRTDRKASTTKSHPLRFVSLLVAPLALALFSSPVGGQGILDDFNDNITDTTLWSAGTGGTGVQVQEINQRVEVSFQADASDDPSAATFWGGYGSNAALSGDFDIQVDYELLTWPFSSGVRVGLGTVSGAVERISFGDATNDYPGEPRESYLTHFDDGVNGIAATADPSGTLRMVRQGATVTGFYWDAVNSQWVTIHSGPTSTADTGFGFSAWSHDYAFTDQEVRVAFDNVRINDLTAVPEPGTVALGGALCGAGVLTWRRLRRRSAR